MIRRIVSVVVILAACATALVLGGASEEKKSKRYKIVFDNAFGLTEGGDLRVSGVKAGKTVKFDLFESKSDPIKAAVQVELTEPGFGDFREDASCSIRQQSLIGEYYVDCQPGSGKALPDDGTGTVPVEQTTSTIPLDLVNNVLRRPYRERLRLIIAELGTGLAGRPDDLAETIRRAHPGLRETVKTLDLLADQEQIIKDFITDSDKVVGELERKKADVSRFVKEAGETAEISASREPDLRAQFQKLPRFLGELEPYMARLEDLTDEQIPLLADLQSTAPELNRFFMELGPFSEASRPAVRSLGQLSLTGREAIRESSDEINELRQLAVKAPRLGKPLRQLLQSLDDRRRSIQAVPELKEPGFAPPAPDKTAIGGARAAQGPPSPPTGGGGDETGAEGSGISGQDRSGAGPGYTGFESFWNYIFQQTLAINGFDDISHLLRAFVVEGPTSEECAPYSVDPSTSLQSECGSYTGPYQPGLTHEQPNDATGVDPDPTERRGAGALATSAKGSKRRGAGDPEAPADRGEVDPSQPQVTAGPKDVRDILRRQPRNPADLAGDILGRLGSERRADEPTDPADPQAVPPDTQLLDFLLGP